MEEYLVDLNATQAAIRAGYSEKTAKEIGCENLTKPHIAAAVEAGKKALADEAGINAEWVRKRLKIEAELTGKGSSHSARVAALALAAKIANMLTDKIEHSGQVAQVHVYLPKKNDRSE